MKHTNEKGFFLFFNFCTKLIMVCVQFTFDMFKIKT